MNINNAILRLREIGIRPKDCRVLRYDHMGNDLDISWVSPASTMYTRSDINSVIDEKFDLIKHKDIATPYVSSEHCVKYINEVLNYKNNMSREYNVKDWDYYARYAKTMLFGHSYVTTEYIQDVLNEL